MRFLLAAFACLAFSFLAHAKEPVAQMRTKHSNTNISTSAWTLLGTLARPAQEVWAFNASNSGTLLLAVGDVTYKNQIGIIEPGVSNVIPLSVGAGSVFIKATDATISTGATTLNFYLAY